MAATNKVILDHDGGVDDLVALALLAGYTDKAQLIGVICIDADCFIDPAVEVSGKLLSGMQAYGRKKYGDKADSPYEYLGKVPVGRSTLQAVHEFPREWRADAIKMNDLPCVNSPVVKDQWKANNKHEVSISGEELLAELVMKQGSPTDKVTICATGPLSNVAYCITKYGKAFTDNVESVILMGGALDVHGNVYLPGTKVTDSAAEWNIYWDAPSAKVVLESPDVKNILFALDITNEVPVNSDFVQRFGHQQENGHTFLNEFIGSSWAMCCHFPIVFGPVHSYYAWDTLTAAWLVHPTLAQDLEKVPIEVNIEKDSPQEGRTKRLTAEEAAASGINSQCYVPKKVYAQQFYDTVLECARRI